MAILGTYEDVDLPFLNQYAQDNDVQDTKHFVNKVIGTPSGLLLNFWDSPFIHFLFHRGSITKTVLDYLEEASADYFKPVDGLIMVCTSSDGRKVSFLTENKLPVQVEKRYTASGNTLYHLVSTKQLSAVQAVTALKKAK